MIDDDDDDGDDNNNNNNFWARNICSRKVDHVSSTRKSFPAFYVFEPAHRPVNIQTLMEEVDFVVWQCSFANGCISKKVFEQNLNFIAGISMAAVRYSAVRFIQCFRNISLSVVHSQ